MNVLYDNKGHRIGQTNDVANKKVVYDRTGSRVGYYDKSTNSTYDKNGKRVGTSDQTARFLR